MLLETIDRKIKREMEVCKMAEEPPTFGIHVKPSDPLWSSIKEKKEFLMDGNRCKVVQEIDIGENTWFIFEIL